MLRAMVSSPRQLIFGLTLGFLSAFGLQAPGQTGPSVAVGNLQLRGVPDDWSHHHVMFSNPGTEQDAIQSGHYAEWQKAVKEPRYVLQQMKRNLPVQGPSSVDAEYRSRWISETSGGRDGSRRAREDFKPRPDFERHPGGPFRGGGRFPQLFPGGVKNDWNQSVGTGLSSTAINFPAKWSFATGSESCTTDYVVFATGQTGSAAQATIMADYNLYSSCGGTDPLVNWQYNTGTGSTAYLAPEFSYDGTQVAFIQSNGTAASLVLLRYKLVTSGSGALSTPTSQTAANYYNGGAGCTAPCMYTIPLSGGPNDTWSNPYYDYTSDTLYVGDSGGKLHKFTPVFKGAPAEVTTTWPIQMMRGATTDNNQLASPVYDSTSGNIFVGSTTSVSTTTGGYFYAVKASTGAIQGYSSIQLDKQYGVRDGPLIDPVAETAYVFSGYNASNNSAVYQFSASGFSGSTAATATVSLGTGANSDLAYMFAGTFDNTYFTSSSGTTPTGNLYVCGTGHTAPGGDTLEQVAVTNGVMSTTPTIGPNVDTTLTYYPRCSPLTEFYNSNAVVTAATTATGSITVNGTPATSWAGITVTVGSVPYMLVTAINGPNQVLLHAPVFGGTGANGRDTAQNFSAVLDANAGECADTGCVGTGQTANAAVTHPVGYIARSRSITLTAATTGTAGNFTLTSSNTGDISVSGGNNGVDGTTGKDYLFVSVFASTETGCTNNVADGCVMSFDITTPSSFSGTTAPLGTLNISSPALNTLTTGNPAAPTSGIVIDNDGTAGGESQIYFLTQLPTGTTACVTGGADGICAIQATQSAP